MNEPIDLKLCFACRTGIPVDAVTCPSCGAPQPAGEAPPGAGPGPASPFDALGGLPFDPSVFAATSGRSMLGTMARGFLTKNRGCLLFVLLFLFGPPIALGAASHGALGALGGALLVVGGLGVILTGWLVWLLRGAGGGRGRPR